MHARSIAAQRRWSWPLPFACAWAWALSACPAEPCEEPPREVALAGVEGDPNLGTFRGSLLWLQTGQETELVVHAEPEVSAVDMSCSRPFVEVQYRAESADGLLALLVPGDLLVEDDGSVSFESASLTADAQALVDAGKLPEAIGIGARDPDATLTLTVESDGTWSAVVTVSTSTDSFSAAAATLQRDPS
jgi:hypothetical protein